MQNDRSRGRHHDDTDPEAPRERKPEMSMALMSSILDGSLAGFGIMAAVMLLVTSLTTGEPGATAVQADGVQADPGNPVKTAA